MNCQEVMELMQRHVDGDLDQQEIALMMAHVGGCPDCAVMLERLQRLSDDLSQLPRVEPKFSIVDAIMPQLDRLEPERFDHSADEETQVAASPIRSERPRGRLLGRLSGVVAAGVIAGILLLSQQLQLSNKDSDNDASVASEYENSAMSLKAAGDGATMKDSAPAAAPEARAAEPSSAAAEKSAPSSLGGNAAQEAPAASDKAIENGSAASVAEPGITSFDAVDQYGDEEIVTPTVNSEEAMKSKAPVAGSMNYSLSVPATALVSPDGQWRAVAIEGDGTLRIYATKDDSVVFQSEQRTGSLSRLAWDQGSKQLTYTWTDEQGKETDFAYDADKAEEIMR